MTHNDFALRTISRRTFLRMTAALGAGTLLGVSGCTSLSASTCSSTANESDTPAYSSTTPTDANDLSSGALATFMLMSDVHINNGNGDAIIRFRQALADIASLEQRPDAIAVIGDLSDQG